MERDPVGISVYPNNIPYVAASNFINEYLLNASSNEMAIVGVPTVFTYTPSGADFVLHRFIIYLEDSINFSAALFGGISALSNGVLVEANGSELVNWKSNIDIFETMYDTAGAGEAFGKLRQIVSGRWSLFKALGGKGLLIPNGQTVQVTIRDDLSALDTFRFRVQGYLL